MRACPARNQAVARARANTFYRYVRAAPVPIVRREKAQSGSGQPLLLGLAPDALHDPADLAVIGAELLGDLLGAVALHA